MNASAHRGQAHGKRQRHEGDDAKWRAAGAPGQEEVRARLRHLAADGGERELGREDLRYDFEITRQEVRSTS